MADPFSIAPNPVLAGRRPGDSFNTALDPGMEEFFRMWLAHNKVPFNPQAEGPQDYDMRGFFRGLMQGDPRARSSVNGNDGQMHYPDFWKTPLHATASNESQWMPASAPQWTPQDTLAQAGRVLFDERAVQPFGMVVGR